MFRIHRSFAFRLTLWYASAFVFFLLAALLALYLSMNSILAHRIDEDLHEDIEEFKLLLASADMDRVQGEIERETDSGHGEDVFLRLFDTRANALFSSDLTHWEGLKIDTGMLEQFKNPTKQPELLTLALASQDSDTRVIYGAIGPGLVLQIGESLENKDDIMGLLFKVFVSLLFTIIPVASAVVWLLARQASRGIEEVSRAAIDIEQGEFNRRVSLKAYDDEIETLATTFNAMAERIRDLVAEMREMIDNIAHDLRSPLARIRAISESVLFGDDDISTFKKAAADTLAECDRLIKLINTTLDVAEVEARVANSPRESIDLSNLLKDACELFEPVAEEQAIDLTCSIETGCRLTGHRQNLQRMLANILDNALKYTPSPGKVSVELKRSAEGIQISVVDTGHGIPESDQHRVFERFFRCDESRGRDGCGLGLSFARAVARAHEGDIDLTSVPGEGSRFTISLSDDPLIQTP